MAAYYNEHNPDAAAWLRELIADGLIADGEVDERDIEEVSAGDVRGFTQCHWFAGIGGWSYALRLAGWADSTPAWTGSCPCQRLSSAARGRNVAADLWPDWRQLIAECQPGTLFGEQVVRAWWFDRVADDLETLGYAVGACIIPAYSVGQDHARERIYFAGHPDSHRESRLSVDAKVAWVPRRRREPGPVVPTHGLSRDMVALAGFGNAIVPQVAAAFIGAYMEAR